MVLTLSRQKKHRWWIYFEHWRIKNQLDVTCYYYFSPLIFNMFQALICPSSGVCKYVVELPNSLISFLVWSTHSKPRTKSANVVVQQHSRKLLKMGILMPETCWVSKKKNKNSKWHLIGFLFFSYHKMHGPINISVLLYTCEILKLSWIQKQFTVTSLEWCISPQLHEI